MSPQQALRSSILSLAVGSALLTLAGGAAAQASAASSARTQSSSSTGSVTAVDKTFVQKAAMGGMAEVELGKLAQQKASSDEVKQFGARMVDDHSKANEELKKVAGSKNITLPTDLDAKHKNDMAKMQKLSGAQFDRAYMDHMVKDHKEDVALFRKESTGGKDADLKGFAGKTLPTLEDHLKMAQTTATAVKNAKSTASR